jgi:hypothetical protein
MGRPNLTTNPCLRCGGGSDMTCPLDEPLEAHLDALYDRGYEPHHHDIDARKARDGMSLCTNCGGRGCFEYTGVGRGKVLRAFWSCVRCGHWIEV